MVSKNPQYEAVKVLIEAGHIKRFEQIFQTIKRTNMSADLGMNYQTFIYRLKRPVAFSLEEMFAIANLIGIDKHIMLELIINQLDSKKKK